MTIYPLSANDVDGAVIRLDDITEKNINEMALRRSQKLEAIGQLTGGIAHDFNNILGIIMGNLQLLEMELAGNDVAVARIHKALKGTKRGSDITRQLLRFSRNQTKSTTQVNINEVIKNMDELITKSLTVSIEVQTHLQEELWLTNIDPGDLEDAILNLSLNAKDAMPNGGTLIIETSNKVLDDSYARCNPSCESGDFVMISVSDNGMGMSDKVKDKVLEPFFTTKDQGKGTGLGLAMVFGFVQRSAGHIKAYTELGLGTTFRLYLPLVEGEEEINPPELEDGHLPRGTESILVVDDEPELLALAQHNLSALGYKVTCAENGAMALETLKKQPEIELLFSDVVMPGGINGYQLAEHALSLNPMLKVLLTSGYTGRAVRNTEQANFETKLISKPYSIAELSTRIRALLGTHQTKHIDNSVSSKLSISKVGIACYDQEHTQVIAFYEQSKRLEESFTQDEFSQLLSQITEYAVNHLPLEEAILEACQYSGLVNHKQVHNLLFKQLELIKSRFTSGNLAPNTLSSFLADWWLDHILTMDAAAMTHCKQFPDIIKNTIESRQEDLDVSKD